MFPDVRQQPIDILVHRGLGHAKRIRNIVGGALLHQFHIEDAVAVLIHLGCLGGNSGSARWICDISGTRAGF